MTPPKRVTLELVALSLLIGVVGPGCLPQTSLPEPGSLEVTATASNALVNGFTSDDGWTVLFSRALVALGRAGVSGDKATTYCQLYPDSHYTRILDMKRSEAQKVALVYSLGQCDFGFALDPPREDAVLGKGVTNADLLFMATPGSDHWTKSQSMSLYLTGTATKGSVTKTFEWQFREHFRYSSCQVGDPDASLKGVSISSGSSSSLDIAIHAEALFQNDTDPTKAELRFQPFADADDAYGNADGDITLDELTAEPVKGVGTGGIGPDGGAEVHISADAGAGVGRFGDYVYRILVPEVPRYRDTGHCVVDTGDSYD
jgi:hypothetical protein